MELVELALLGIEKTFLLMEIETLKGSTALSKCLLKEMEAIESAIYTITEEAQAAKEDQAAIVALLAANSKLATRNRKLLALACALNEFLGEGVQGAKVYSFPARNR